MDNQEAAEILYRITYFDHKKGVPNRDHVMQALRMAISALEAQEIRDLLPVSPLLDKKKKKRKREAISASQPQELSNNSPKLNSENGDLQPTCNNLATDCISRQAAIEALDKRFDKIPMEQTTEILELRKDLRGLPPAQPEQSIAEWQKDFREYINMLNIPRDDYKGIIEYINDVPSAQPEPQWIPVSERMPIKAGHYLCSFEKPNRIDRIHIDLAYWTGGRWYGYMADEITAWKPLPEPYKEDGNDDHER